MIHNYYGFVALGLLLRMSEMVLSRAFFKLFVVLSLQFLVSRDTTTGRLLGPTTCLPLKDEGVPLSAFPKGITSELAGLYFTLTL